jgi:hypothetical protein
MFLEVDILVAEFVHEIKINFARIIEEAYIVTLQLVETDGVSMTVCDRGRYVGLFFH